MEGVNSNTGHGSAFDASLVILYCRRYRDTTRLACLPVSSHVKKDGEREGPKGGKKMEGGDATEAYDLRRGID